MASASKTEDQLFAPASPDVFRVVLPVRWLWHYATRRFALLSPLGAAWNDRELTAELLADGVMYGEGPRFRVRENALYFTDMYGKKVLKYELATRRTTTVLEHASDFVSGLGWLEDGRLLVTVMNSLRVEVVDPTRGGDGDGDGGDGGDGDGDGGADPELYADLSHVARFRVNDCVVDTTGRLYVGNFGFDFTDPKTATTTTLVRVDTDRSVHIAATELFFPNGCVITPDGKTLIVAETFACVLTAFDVAADGSLSNRRVWADVGLPCDGIALDADGCVWAAIPHVGIHQTYGALLRVREGGEILNLYGFGRNGIANSVFACQLGTDAATGKHWLFFFEAVTSHDRVVLRDGPEQARKNGVLKAIEVPVGPARIPGNDRYCGGYC